MRLIGELNCKRREETTRKMEITGSGFLNPHL